MRRTQTRLAALAAMALVPSLAGCGDDDSTAHKAGSKESAGPPLHVVATIDVTHAQVLLPTDDRLWVVTPETGTVTQVDPAANEVVKDVRLPHPAGFGTLAHGSLWLASFYDSALMEVDAESGKLLRTLERSPTLPIASPNGIAATGHDLWVMNHYNGKLLRVDARTGKVTHTTPLTGHHAGLSLAGGSLWVTMAQEGIIYEVDPADGEVVGKPIPVEAGFCVWASVVGTDVWLTGMPTEGFTCRDATSRLDTTSREVTPMTFADGKSLYTFTRYAGSLWATNTKRTLYQVDEDAAALRPVMTLTGKPGPNVLWTAFGSMWMARPEAGELLRLEAS